MNKQALDKLVKALGMAVELAPILESYGGYERFEQGVRKTLERYPESEITKKIETLEATKWKNVYFRRISSFPKMRFPKKIEIFKKHYGIGYNPKSQKELAKEDAVSRQRINQHINNTIRRLSFSERRKDIWYNSL